MPFCHRTSDVTLLEYPQMPQRNKACVIENALTFSSIYTHFNTLKKNLYENIVESGEFAQNEQFYLFPQCFLPNLYLKIL